MGGVDEHDPPSYRALISHPDCDRRPRNHTGSTDRWLRSGRGLPGNWPRFTAGSDFHRAPPARWWVWS